MARTVSFPLYVGRRDSIDPKLAPMGVLSTCKNLRVRKDGRLSSRHGYGVLSMDSLVAFDLHQFQDRLVAFGSKELDGYPQQVVEYTGIASANVLWRRETAQQELTPFVDLRDITIASPPSSGVDEADSAAGGGFVCVVQRSVDGAVMAVIVRESDNQPICTELISSTKSARHCRVTYAAATSQFYIMSVRSDNSIDILNFAPASSTAWNTFVNQAFSSSATAPAIDIAPITNQTTGLLVIGMDRGAASDLTVRIYGSNGSAVGSDITLAGTDTISLSVAADQTANKIHLGTVITGGDVSLRTWNFSGVLQAGPSTVSPTATHVAIARLPPPATALSSAQVAVVYATASATVVNLWAEVGHGVTATSTVDRAILTTRVIPWHASTHTDARDTYQIVFGAYISPVISSTNDATNAIFYYGAGTQFCVHMATRDFIRAMPRSYRGIGLHLDSTTSRVTWCALKDGGSGSAQVAVTTFPRHSTARRQAVRFGNLLYIAGAPMQVYDGRCLTEPFQEVPGIISATASNSSGTLTNSATYTYVVHWEVTLADGSFWQSPLSDPTAVTMGASDDTVTLVVSTPHHSAVGLGDLAYGAELTAVVSRTVFSSGVEGSIYRRSVTKVIPAGISSYGDSLSIVDTVPDSTLATQEAVYTQGARGNLSGVLEHNAPRAGKFVAASESRLYVAGQLANNQFQASKEAFLGEPFTFSEFSTFFGQVAGTVRGLFSLDGARLVFTADEIFAVTGGGPDDLGGGELQAPVRIPSPSGLEDWRSLLETPEGLYFQLDDGKLYMLPRGGGAPVWAGIEIQDTLASYPVITGACKSRRDDAILFACQNTSAGTDGRIVVRSQRTGIWTEDTPPLTSSEGIEAICSYGDSVAYVTGGVVYVQSTSSFADGSSTVITTQLTTQPLYPFGVGNTGLIHDVLIDGEYRSAGTLALRVSYDDGVSFSTLTPFTLTGLTAGQTVQRQWALPQVGARSLVLEWTFTPTSAGEGFIAKSATMLVTPDDGLPPLQPAEMA